MNHYDQVDQLCQVPKPFTGIPIETDQASPICLEINPCMLAFRPDLDESHNAMLAGVVTIDDSFF